MLLKKIYVRFYKSFNYDYLKKSSIENQTTHSQAKDWEWVDEERKLWYPYIEIPIDPKITTVVGANESGKSHLLSAISKGIEGKGMKGEKIVFEDFCRYSHFFTVTKDEFRFPDFGFEWKLEMTKPEDESRKYKLKTILNIQSEIKSDSFLMFRTNCTNIILYVDDIRYNLEITKQIEFFKLLPRILPIQSKISLPNSVPIQAIIDIDKGITSNTDSMFNLDLDKWQIINEFLKKICSEKEIPEETHTEGGYYHDGITTRRAENLEKDYCSITSEYLEEIKTRNLLRATLRNKQIPEEKPKQFDLAHKLICKVANIDSNFLGEIIKHSFDDSKQGYVSAIIDRINKNLSEGLNFPSWWVQDKEFKLVVSVSNYHLKFAIKDKTGTTYSFSERSQGLQYFLSYYIQYKSHIPAENQQEILLMDEPDAFLSSQAQQDLMKIFKAFAEGKDQREPVQVIYVTHSPFLIDKNHPDRIRVLEKGTEEQGTRVVRDIARNHYEPLRSSVGCLVGETAYIGNCNLIVPRLSDQVLIAGLATYINNLSIPNLDTLDLNHITIIPAGDTLQIPFLIRLLREDTEKPAMIVFLNSDDDGNKIRDIILDKDQITFSSLKKNFIIQIQQLIKNENDKESLMGLQNQTLIELEDLIPLDLAVEALRCYQRKIFNFVQDELLTVEQIKLQWDENVSLFINLENYLKRDKSNIYYLDRFGFAKFVVDVLKNNKDEYFNEKKYLIHNFKTLFRKLNDIKRSSELDFSQEKISEKVKRIIKSFKMDNPKNASRSQIEQLFKTIEDILDTTDESAKTRNSLMALRGKYETDNNPLSQIKNTQYANFLNELNGVEFQPKIGSQEALSDNEDDKGNGESINSVNDSRKDSVQQSSKPSSRQNVPKQQSKPKGFSS